MQNNRIAHTPTYCNGNNGSNPLWRIRGEKTRFKCQDKCGYCCCVIPIPYDTYKKHKIQVKNEVTDFIVGHNTTFVTGIVKGNTVIPITENGDCAFLDHNKKCSIYEDRPEVCRLYGIIPELPCPYVDQYGIQRPVHEIGIVKEYIKIRTKKFLKDAQLIGAYERVK